MAETPTSEVMIGRALFLGLAATLIFVQLLPLDLTPVRWPAPDLLLAVTMLWVARRPDLVPFPVIVLIFLLTDLLFQRPPGLWTALVLIATEMLRARRSQIRNMPFALEWGTVAVAIVGVTVANRVVLFLVMMPQPSLGLTLLQMLATIVAYPACMLFARVVFGVARPAPGQVDSFGHRL